MSTSEIENILRNLWESLRVYISRLYVRHSKFSGETIRVPKIKHTDLKTSDYNFSKFAATYFNPKSTSYFSKLPLKKSLLHHPRPNDEISAQAVWIMILRFMGDTEEPKTEEFFEDQYERQSLNSPIMERLVANLTKINGHSLTDIQKWEAMEIKNSDHHRVTHKTLKRKTKLPQLLRNALNNSDEVEYYHQTLSIPSSKLEKLHFIIGHAIIKPQLRDEIFCQLCKQLTGNPNKSSVAKGWILLSLCLGCVPPSRKFEQFLRTFIRSGPEQFAEFCEQALDRTLKNGARKQPPSWLELQAIRKRCPMTLNFFLLDGNTKRLQIDSSSTSKEAVDQLAENMGLTDSFGFSIVISLFDKTLSLGCENEHIMDAISNCEQYAKEQGQDERKAPWKLFLRKELFSPWYDPSLDQLATHLVYKQVTRGLNLGEYRCKSEKDVAMLCAIQYFIEYGPTIDPNILHTMIPDCVPKDFLSAGERAYNTWENLITDVFNKVNYSGNNISKNSAREDVAIYAHLTWPMVFSRLFEAFRTSGPRLLSDNLVISVNSLGVYFIDEFEQILAELSYPEIHSVLSVDEDELQINTIQKEDFTFKCHESKVVCDLINFILDNLKNRSKYAIVVEDYKPSSRATDHLSLVKGDLVILEKGITGEMVMDKENRWAQGECNGVRGAFPTETVYVVATLNRPSDMVLEIFKESDLRNKELNISSYTTVQRKRMHTLKKFAEYYFRPNISEPFYFETLDELWSHSGDPIRAPLLKKLQRDRELIENSVLIFSSILKYMGDIPRGKQPVDTDLIFGSALENEHLRDELYCQLMKQLTDNRVLYSEERGWDLMWLATGVMYPSSLVLKELFLFLRTRSHPLAVECLKRIRKTLASGQRKNPPFVREIEAIQKRSTKIYHEIHFPNDTREKLEIRSSTRGFELCSIIAKRFDLKSLEGFSLFVRICDKAFSIPGNEYIFDFISELMKSMKEVMTGRTLENNIFPYELYFMKKLWLAITPGKDLNADYIFHYSQEVPKYLHGYYNISTKKGAYIAGILYRIQYGGNMVPLHRIHEVLPKLLPVDVIALEKSNDWKTEITKVLQELGNLDEAEGKNMFLEEMSKFSMFGSTFFLVKQTNDHSLPETLLIAINLKGFHIIDPKTKETLQKYEYSELSLWSSGNTFFHIRFGNMIDASKLLCCTTQGYKMDDLLSSYMKYLNDQH